MIDRILQALSYDPERPLLFTQLYFWVFFGLVLSVYSLIYRKRALRNAFLFFVSLFFYYKTSGFYFIILIVSTLADFFIGKRIYRTQSSTGKKLWLASSIVVNLFLLVYFKYAYFFAGFFTQVTGIEVQVYNYFSWAVNTAVGTDFIWERILLPVGISFFTFQTISYSVDIYRGHIKPVTNILDFGFYVSFFPQLVAGPIVRAADFIPQLYKDYKLSREDFGRALFWIINGLLKKLFLADFIAVNFVDRVFAAPGSHSGFENLMALFGYSLQVYADFSGYTDIAIGVAMLLGFQLPLNFNSPYKANSVAEFWRRWHISLSTWLRDYLYIPMGGNRSGSLFSYIMIGVVILFVSLMAASWAIFIVLVCAAAALYILGRLFPRFGDWGSTNVNLMLTMLIGGLWHGSSWNFVVWGGLNGLGLVVYKLWKKISPWQDKSKWYWHAWSVLLTLTFITFTRTFFRGENWESSILMLDRIFNSFQPELIPQVLVGFKWPMIVMLLGYIIHWLPAPTKLSYQQAFIAAPAPVKVAASLITVFFIYQILSADLQPFIYFAF